MNRQEYLGALRAALSGLPDEELQNAMQYYQDYFDDAGSENEQKVIQELGTPQHVAAAILADYHELTTLPHPPGNGAGQRTSHTAGSSTGYNGGRAAGASGNTYTTGSTYSRPRQTVPQTRTVPPRDPGFPLIPFLITLFCIIVIGIPLLCILFVLAVTAFVIILTLFVVGLTLLLYGLGQLFTVPANALISVGAGMIFLAISMVAAAACVLLLRKFLPPLFRWFIGLFHRQTQGG